MAESASSSLSLGGLVGFPFFFYFIDFFVELVLNQQSVVARAVGRFICAVSNERRCSIDHGTSLTRVTPPPSSPWPGVLAVRSVCVLIIVVSTVGTWHQDIVTVREMRVTP